MKNSTRYNRSFSLTACGAVLLSGLLLSAGCAQNPDIRLGHDRASGTTLKGSTAFISCIKDEVREDIDVVATEESGNTNLFVGSLDPNSASGLVEISTAGDETLYSVYQRYAWQDKGRLINTAVMCSRT
ncbi:hypothetical protein HP532_15930 [Pseudomonas sp. CrR25]|nr:hypothetical protein [Pseudomonas sp. CrR25]